MLNFLLIYFSSLVIIYLLWLIYRFFKKPQGKAPQERKYYQLEANTNLEKFKFKPNKNFFPPNKLLQFNFLKKHLGSKYHVFPDVRLADLLAVKKEIRGEAWIYNFNKISDQHVDFAICKKNDSGLLAILDSGTAGDFKKSFIYQGVAYISLAQINDKFSLEVFEKMLQAQGII